MNRGIYESANENYPTLVKRLQSNYIDRFITYGLIWLFISIAVFINNESIGLKVIAILFALSYEPLAITFYRTVGQIVVGIKVKSLSKDLKITLLNSYGRFGVRLILGWFSFLTMYDNSERRAIHDLMSNTIVVDVA